ncbi:hypothetical protein G9A89_009762 [Geosiphon pyriformis]|nr:hypothetical protein G9A89_009762 [Geosiphon pyriformis]
MFGKIHQQFDVIIEAGKYPNLKAFPAHSLVLNVNSPYFQVEIAALSVTNLDKIIIKIPFIPPNIMETLLKYMYNGIICLDTDDNNEIMNLLVAAYDLGLQNACQDLQLYLIQKKSVWLLQNFAQTKKIAQQHEDPEVLISLLPRDDLAVNEIRIWMRLIEWGIAHTPNIKANSFLWTPQDFYALRKTLIPFVSFIRLFNIPFDDFRSKVLPFELILPKELASSCSYSS